MRNAFNLLLVTMAIFDSTYLFGSILESFRMQFHCGTNLQIRLFPYLLYPFHQVRNTWSIINFLMSILLLHQKNVPGVIKYLLCVSTWYAQY